MEANEKIDKFITALMAPNATYEELKKFLTFTQQEDCKYLERVAVDTKLQTMRIALKQFTKIGIEKLPQKNACVADFKIVEKEKKGKNTYMLRLVKEYGYRKPGKGTPDNPGVWGVNISSFGIKK